MDISQRDRAEIEAGMAAELAGANADLANQLAAHLRANPIEPQISDEFYQEVETKNRDLLGIWLLLTWGRSTSRHGWDGEEANEAGILWAEKRAEAVAKKFTETTRDRVEATVNRWREKSKPAEPPPGRPDEPSPPKPESPEKPTPEEIDEEVEKILGPERAETVAVTETSNAVTDASDAAMDRQGLVGDDDLWITEEDGKVCYICNSLHNKPRTVWAWQFDHGPPAHPNCRCYIEYAAERELAAT